MNRITKQQLKELEEETNNIRQQLFEIVTDLELQGKLDTGTYVDATTAIHNMRDVFVILKKGA